MAIGGGNQVGRTPSDFREYARILLARRRILVCFVGIACVVAVVLSLIGPEVYHAQVSLLPEETKGLSLSSLMSGPSSLDLMAGLGRREGAIFLEMLRSRSVFEGVVRQCDLIREFKFDKLPEARGMEETVRLLKKRAKFDKSEAGIISVDVSVATPFFPRASTRRKTADLAAGIANAFSDQLNIVNREKATSRARAVRIYLEQQIKITEARMKTESDSLVYLQLTNRAIAIEDQTKAAIQSAGEIKGKIIAGEMELNILRQTMLPDNPQIHAIESKLEELRKQYSKLEYGAPKGTADSDSKDFQVPFADLPAIAQQQAMVMRDLTVQQTVFELLNQQYYKAKIQETGDVPSLTVLDQAFPPVYRSWPRRSLLCVLTFILSGMIGILIVFWLEYRDRNRGVPISESPSGLAEAWRTDKTALRAVLRRSDRGKSG